MYKKYNEIMDFIVKSLEGIEGFEHFKRIDLIENEEHFAYNYIDGKIHVNENKDDKDFAEFMVNYLKEQFGLEITEDKLYIFNFIHEVGHSQTIDNVNTTRYYDEVKGISADDYLSYRQIHAEYMADLWAAQFIEAFEEVLNI